MDVPRFIGRLAEARSKASDHLRCSGHFSLLAQRKITKRKCFPFAQTSPTTGSSKGAFAIRWARACGAGVRSMREPMARKRASPSLHGSALTAAHPVRRPSGLVTCQAVQQQQQQQHRHQQQHQALCSCSPGKRSAPGATCEEQQQISSSFRRNDDAVVHRCKECPRVTSLDPGLRRDDGS